MTTPEIADWTAVHDLVPDALDAIIAIQHAVEETVDRDMLELMRVRVATVLGVPPIVAGNWSAALEQKVAVLSDWPTSPLFSASERSRLSLAEQFVIDVNGVTDTMVAAVLDDLGPSGTYRVRVLGVGRGIVHPRARRWASDQHRRSSRARGHPNDACPHPPADRPPDPARHP